MSLECANDLNEVECEEVVNKCLHECGRCQGNVTVPATTRLQPLTSTASPDTGGKCAHYLKSVKI